jgi:hypothetical protein
MAKDRLIEALKEFRKECNTVRSYINFKRITTVGEALEKLGAIGLTKHLPDSPITRQSFEAIEFELRWQLIDTFLPDSTIAFQDTDALIESGDTTLQETPTGVESDQGIGPRTTATVTAVEPDRKHKYKELVTPILPPPNPSQKASLFYFQQNAAEAVYWKLIGEDKPSVLMRAATGDGKTYAYAQVLRWIVDAGKIEEWKSISPTPILVVTKASIVEQTRRVLKWKFGLDHRHGLKVVNYDALRASFGERFISEKMVIEGGIEHYKYEWHRFLHPAVIVWDECQSLKNEDPQQTKIASAFNDISLDSAPTKQIFSSATPFSRLAGAKCFAVSTRHEFRHGSLGGSRHLTNKSWMDFAQSMTADGTSKSVYEYNKSNIKRLLEELDDYIVGFKNVRRKHKPINVEEIIDFETEEQRQEYETAWQKYLEKRAKIERDAEKLKNSAFLILVELLKFRQAAEFIRAPILARRCWEAVQSGKQVVVAACFKPTIAKIVSILHDKYNVDRDQISLIWGGTAAYSKQPEEKYSKEDIAQIFKNMIQTGKFEPKILKEIAAQVMAQEQGLDDLPPELKLGNQSREQRQDEIDKFQSGRSMYCFFTFGAGGAGLSLHHTYEFFEDRPGEYELVTGVKTTWPESAVLYQHKKTKKYYTTLPRITYITPTWNEMELEQALGRVPRLTSLSDTYQTILLFRGTVEVNVLRRVNQKRVCLSAVVAHTEMDDEAKRLTEAAGSTIRDDEDYEDEEGSETFEEMVNE